jgi:hypothetical protein
MQRLIGAEVAFAEDHDLSQRPVRDFIADFRGLSATAKTKAICDSLQVHLRLTIGRKHRLSYYRLAGDGEA